MSADIRPKRAENFRTARTFDGLAQQNRGANHPG
jgi:hypothetical protein